MILSSFVRKPPSENGTFSDPASVLYNRCTVDLTTGTITFAEVPCQNLEDVLGGFGRSFQILAKRDISDAFATTNPLVVNTGLLTGTNVMTGLRTYFSAYSPLKVSNKGLPAAMWSAGSGKFGTKLKWTGLDEIIVEGKSDRPVVLVVRGPEDADTGGPTAELHRADQLLGLPCYRKITTLHQEYPDAHFAVIGPAGEHYQNCYFAAVALSTENLLRSGDDKCRWAGRGGMGAVMGSKNLIGIVADVKDKVVRLTPEIRELNKEIASGQARASSERPTAAG